MQLNQFATLPNITLANVYYNADMLGLHHVTYAESLGFAHEFDVKLKDAKTQKERYLLLKELVSKKLTDTEICKKTIVAIADNCDSLSEIITLRYSVAFSEKFLNLVRIKQKQFPFVHNTQHALTH